MAVYSTNQNRHFFVAKKKVDSVDQLKEVGDFTIGHTMNGESYLTFMGPDTPIRTDLIKNIEYTKVTMAGDQRRRLKKTVVALDPNVCGGEPVVGQDYVIRIMIDNLYGTGIATVKNGVAHAFAGMSAGDLYKKLAESLNMNLSKEGTPLFKVEASADGVTITEEEQPWHLGTMKQEPVLFKVYCSPITYQGNEVLWAKLEKDGSTKLENSDVIVGNGKRIADLEWFCMGERGDQYRNNGFPNVIPTTYLIDPSKEYNTLDVHFAFRDTGVNSYKSEKDIIIVEEAGGSSPSVLHTIRQNILSPSPDPVAPDPGA